VITRDPRLLGRFVALGFRPGLTPRRPSLGGMHDLTAIILEALKAPSPPDARPNGEAP